MKKYRTLLFDADNTLMDFTRSEHDAICDCFEEFGLPHTEEHIADYSAINDNYWKMLERGEVKKIDLFWLRFDTFCKKYGFGVDPKALCREYMKALATKSYLLDGTHEVISALYGKYDLYLITNGDKMVQSGRFDPSPIAKFFIKSYISEDVGYEKPSEEYFDFVKNDIPGFDANSALVIGDSLTSDIAGGIKAGIDTCWFNPHGKAKPDGMDITYTIKDIHELLEIL